MSPLAIIQVLAFRFELFAVDLAPCISFFEYLNRTAALAVAPGDLSNRPDDHNESSSPEERHEHQHPAETWTSIPHDLKHLSAHVNVRP